MSTFTDVFVREDDSRTHFSFRSGLTVYNEVFECGALRSRGWNLAGYVSAPEVLASLDGRTGTEAFQLEVAGEDLISGWELVRYESNDTDSGIRHEIELTHPARQIGVVVHTELDGTAVLARRLELVNHSDGFLPVARVAVWSGLMWTPQVVAGMKSEPPRIDLGYMQDSRQLFEGAFDWVALPESELVVGARTKRPPHRHPMFVARVAQTGAHFIGQLGWSGGYAFAFDYERYHAGSDGGRSPWLSFRASMDAPAPQIVLEPGELVPTATMHLGGVIGGLDDAIEQMITHVRTSVLVRDPERLGLVMGGVGPEQEVNAEIVMHELESHARVGTDVFWIDANWYSEPGGSWHATVGDWQVNEGRFPEGLAPIREAAKRHGMKFGLWMEPERLGSQSRNFGELAALRTVDYDDNPNRELIDLGDPAAEQWMLDTIREVIAGNELDFYRIDFNVGMVGDGFHRARGGYRENHYWRYYLAHYRIFAQLREEFPDVLFQTCASGGARTDLGMVAGFDDTWVTDWQLAPRSFSIINGMSMVLPPEYLDRLIGMGQANHLLADHDFQLRLGLFGRPSVTWPNPKPSQRNPVHEGRTRHMLDLYREVIQPLRDQTRIHHHTPTGFDERWGVLERSALDASVSIIGLFRLGSEGPDTYIVRPRGIDSGCRYRVRLDNEDQTSEIDGATLIREGIEVYRDAALTSQLLVLQAVPVTSP